MSFSVPNYTLQETLAEDVLTFLHIGHHTSSGKSVLIWQYKPEFLTATLAQTLLEIGKKLSTIHHPALLPILTFGVQNSGFYIVHPTPEEWMTLEEFLETKPSVSTCWNLSIQILDGMKELETQGQVNGSLTPSQIWVTRSQKIIFTKVALAIAILQSQWKKWPAIDDAHCYPPEFYTRGRFGITSDLYAFGSLLYALFSETLAYPPTPLVEKAKHALSSPSVIFKQRFQNIPNRIRSVAHICMEPNPNNRFASFNQMIQRFNQNDTIPEPNRQSTTPQKKKGRLFVSNQTWMKVGIGLLGIGLVGWGLQTMIIKTVFQRDTRVVPNLVGLTVDQATVLLQENQLHGEVVAYKAHNILPEGYVIESRPPAGRDVKESRLVQLIVSKGQSEFKVPNIVGKLVQNLVLPALATVNILESKPSETEPKGMILSQSPSPNTFLSTDTPIQITVSDGYPVTVQTLVGIGDQIKLFLHIVIPSGWPPQTIEYHYEAPGAPPTIAQKLANPGSKTQIELSVKPGGTLTIHANGKSVLTQKITTPDT